MNLSFRERYVRYSLITIIIVLGLVLLKESAPYIGGILGAFTVYILVRKQMLHMTEVKHMRRSVVATLLIVETILCLLIPLSLLVWLLIHQIQNITFDVNGYIASAQHFSEYIQQKTGYNLLREENIASFASILPTIGQALMNGISSFGINVLVLLFVLYFMIIGGRKMERYMYEILPFRNTDKKDVVEEIYMIVKSNAIGIPLLALIQGGVAMLGYYIFDTPSPFIMGVLTAIATIIPIVGTAIVFVPLIIYMLITKDWGNAIGLAVYSIVVITNVDNLARFMLQKKIADIHPLITIFGVVIGIPVFGFMGVIFGPLLISMFILCVNLFKEEYLEGK